MSLGVISDYRSSYIGRHIYDPIMSEMAPYSNNETWR